MMGSSLMPMGVRVRLLGAAAVMTGLFLALGAKAWKLQIKEGPRLTELAHRQYRRELVLPPPRGSIRDTNGIDLAVSVNVGSAFVNPREVADVARTAPPLAAALRLDVREVEDKLASTRKFEWLKRHIVPDEARLLRALALPGVGVVAEPRRYYPNRQVAGTVLGFAGLDGRGLEGVELSLDATLRGKRTRAPVIRDRRGELVIPAGAAPAAVPGANVTLTIDRTLQWIVERALDEGVRENMAKAGLVVMLDPRTGAVLAMASWPQLDPNDPGDREARNRPVTDAYEPGSVMKVFSVVSALDAGAVAPEEMIDTGDGRLLVGRHYIRDVHAHGLISVAQVIKFSSNVGAAKIARRLGKERLHDGLVRLGFGARTGIRLPGESPGFIRPAKRWGEAALATHAYGYGMRATPLQIAAALSAVAMGGVWHRPYIVKRIELPDGTVKETVPETRRVLAERSARQMVEMLKLVVEKGGTAERVRVPGYVVAGKTGTAYKLDPVTKRYAKHRYLASFIGFAPADDPRLLMVTMIDEPSAGKHYGGTVAGPIFAAIAGEALKYLGVAPTEPIAPAKASGPEPRVETEAPEAEPVPDVEIVEDSLQPLDRDLVQIPDFTGLSVGAAVRLARDQGVRIDIEGTGRAVKQFPPPGRALKSITCHVTFDPG